MVGVSVRQHQVPDQTRIKPFSLNVGDDILSAQAGTNVDKGEFSSTIEQVDVAIKGIAQIKPIRS